VIRIKLGAADRETLGAPDVMEVDPTRTRLADVRALKSQTGFTVESLGTALQSRDLDAVAALVWLALRRSGVNVPFDELDFDFGDLDLEVDDTGKASSSSTGS